MKLRNLFWATTTVLLSVTACSTSGWTKQDEEELLENCFDMATMNLPEATAEIYCNCQLRFLKEKFETSDDVRKIMQKDPQGLQRQIQDECLEFAKSEARKQKQ